MVTKERLTMSVEEASEQLSVCRATGYKLAREGKLPGCFRLGDRRLIVSKAALNKFLESGGEIPS